MTNRLRLTAALGAAIVVLYGCDNGGGNSAAGGPVGNQSTDFVELVNGVIAQPETAAPAPLNDMEFTRLDDQSAFDNAL